MFATLADQTSQAGDDDASDSDATNVTNPAGSPAGTFPVIGLTTGGPGANSHRFDVGFAMDPSAAAVTVSGRVMLADGTGIRGARVTLTEMDGTEHHALTGGFGYYQFFEIASGQGAVIRVSAKRFRFTESVRFLYLDDNVSDIDFIADR
jgi:hypothetical protein